MIDLTHALPMLQPVVLLCAWSLVMWVWLYAVRIPALKALNEPLDASLPRGEQMSRLPPRVRWKADNYNHLMEQPTIFYPLAICLAMLGVNDGVALYASWTYVILRIIHSLFQALVNIILIRFVLFNLSGICLVVLSVVTMTKVF